MLKPNRLGWFGHTHKNAWNQYCKENIQMETVYSTNRPVGRPQSRWEDEVRNDLRKTKLIKWAEQVQDSLKWKDIVEKAKTVPEL